jgi:hypothetical protein
MRRPWREPSIAPARRRWLAGAATLGLVWLSIWTPSAASTAVPYKDPNAVGSIGLCDAHGHQVTSGSVSTAPFAWRAVSTSPAPGAYAGPTRTSVLMAFQPIQGLAPSDWSGDSLTAASRYSNPSNPMAAATGADESLAGFMTEYSPKWDGILQLRLYLDAANEPVYSLHYPALDIKVTRNTWHALDGGPVDCNAGTAVSIESILLPASTLKTPASSSTTKSAAGGSTAGAAGASTTTTPTTGAAAKAGAAASPESATPNDIAPSTSSSDHSGEWAVGAVVVALALVLLVVVLVRSRGRRRRAVPGPAASAPTEDRDADRVAVPSTKGSTP